MNGIIKPDSQPGWSSDVPLLDPATDSLESEFDAERQVLVFRYRRGLGLPVYVPVPLPGMLGICGMLLSAMAQGHVGPVRAHTKNPTEELTK